MKCYLLQWYVNAYDQEGAVTLAVFSSKPTFADIKKHISKFEINCPRSEDAICGMLSRMETVSEYESGGGNRYVIEQWELL